VTLGSRKLCSKPQAIAINGRNIEAYLQRAVVRREMHNDDGMSSDANTVIALANDALQQNPNDPNLYTSVAWDFASCASLTRRVTISPTA
jgi:hypothetical protein